MTVPCGKCPECIAQKRAEWSLRSQLEYDWCVRNGGYVYFDTLTYTNDKLPRFRDHACFQRKHIQDFLKRLRKRIATELKITQRAFRYFYVSEYGHKYKRPHYHILFFISSDIPVAKFKKYISDSWIFGFTDLTSVRNPLNGIVKSQLCCEYVAKYVSKPDDYIGDLYESMRGDISKDDFRKYFYPFHQQSTGFGESLLFDSRQLENFKEMFCVFRRKKYTLPMYYIRRLYYKLVKNPDGSQSWRENDLGLQFVPQYKYMLYEDYSKNLCSFVDAIPQFLRVPGVFAKVSQYFGKKSDFIWKDVPSNDNSYESICRFVSRYDRDFVSRFAFWKRFEQGYMIYDKSFNPLVNFAANESSLLEFNVFESEDRSILAAALDAATVPEFLQFDSLINVIRNAIGDLDNNLLNLTNKTKRLFTYLNYGN